MSLLLAESVPSGVNNGCMASPSLLDCPADTVQMIDHLVRGVLLASARHLGMTCLGLSGSGSLSAGGQTAQKDVQAAVMSFDDVAELVVCEERGTQADSGVGLNLSFS